MTFNIHDALMKSEKKEIWYGPHETESKSTYIGHGFLEPKEKNRAGGPGKGHEEFIFVLNGFLLIHSIDKTVELKRDHVLFLGEGAKVMIENPTDEKVFFIVAGGHPEPHEH